MEARRWIRIGLFVLAPCVLAWTGCEEEPSTPTPGEATVASEYGRDFVKANSGSIHGRITWPGPTPSVPPFDVQVHPFGGVALKERQLRPNPNAPRIQEQGRGVAGAVVFLRGVELSKCRPWDNAPVRVEQRGAEFHVHQGTATGRVGFVRRGERVEMYSTDDLYYSLQARGASFYTLSFPAPGKPRQRALIEPGLVELTSGVGCYWMRAYLFVDDHPYYARTDEAGYYQLPDVPVGRYELVAWLPNWREERHERDPEACVIFRTYFQSPLETTRPVMVEAGWEQVVDLEMAERGGS